MLMVAALGATLAGCSGLANSPRTASLAIAELAGEPAPAPRPVTPEGYVPASVLSYAEVNGPSDDVETLMAYYANAYGVPLHLVRHVAARESGFNPEGPQRALLGDDADPSGDGPHHGL